MCFRAGGAGANSDGGNAVSDDMKLYSGLISFALISIGAIVFLDYQGKVNRANCIVAMKDRPATDILTVCK